MLNNEKRASQEDEKVTHWVDTEPAKGEHIDQIAKHLDYSGAALQTSPEEVRLVKKLDWRIMPCLWSMYFLWV